MASRDLQAAERGGVVSAARTPKPKVVVVGAGFGGLAAARALADAEVEVLVVDQRNHHTFQPLLYQVATAGLDADDICYASRGIFHRQENATAVQARVVQVDFDGQRLITEQGPDINYDYLVMAAGAVTADFGVPGVADHAFGLKTAADALDIRSHVLRCFERAERVGSDGDSGLSALTTIVIVGGGPTGVEMAGGFAELIDRPLRRDFPGLGPNPGRVVLVEGQDRLLATFAPRLGDHARSRLARMGVEVRLSTQVAEVTADEVRLSDGSVVQARTVVWAAGVRAHPLAELMGVETTVGGRVVVDRQLRLPGRANVFAIGDLAASPMPSDGEGATPAGGGASGRPSLVPQVAPGAIQGGEYVAARIADAVAAADGSGAPVAPPEPFRYRDKGSMATIGRNAAVVELPRGPKITGFPGWVAWLALHLVMLIGFRNRANVLVNWAWNYLTYDRASRLIVEPDPPPVLWKGGGVDGSAG